MNRTRTGLVASFVSAGGIQGLNVLTGILLARELGPEGRGELAAVILWPTMLSFLGDLGVAEATMYHTAKRIAPLGTIVGTTVAIALLLSSALVALGFFVVPFALQKQDPNTVETATFFLAFIPINMVFLNMIAVLNGAQLFKEFHAMRFLPIFITALLLVGLAATDSMTVETAMPVYLLANVITLMVAAFLLYRAGATRLRVERGLVRPLVGFGVRTQTSSAAVLLNERLDQLVLSVFVPPAQLGLYVIAVTLTSATMLVGNAVALVALPVVSATKSRTAPVVGTFVRITLLASFAATVPVLIGVPWLIRLFFGEAFEPAAGVARLLLVGAIVLSTNRVLAAVLKGLGRPLSAGLAESVALAVMALGLAALLPTLELTGAALASIAAYTVSSGVMIYRLWRVEGIPVRELLVPSSQDLRRVRELWSERRSSASSPPSGS